MVFSPVAIEWATKKSGIESEVFYFNKYIRSITEFRNKNYNNRGYKDTLYRSVLYTVLQYDT